MTKDKPTKQHFPTFLLLLLCGRFVLDSCPIYSFFFLVVANEFNLVNTLMKSIDLAPVPQ